MSSDVVAEAPSDRVDQLLELGVLEGGELAAALADRVVMMLATRVGRLVTGRAVQIDATHKLELCEDVQRAVDARQTDPAGAGPELLVDLTGAQAALLFGQ